MKAFLMYPGQDFDLGRELPANTADLIQDLELGTLFDAMAAGDQFLHAVARQAILSSLTEPAEIIYRQRVLADCLAQPLVVRDIYGVAVEAIGREKREFLSLFRATPASVLNRSVRVLAIFLAQLRKLRTIADEHAGDFGSAGFTRFFAMLAEELDDGFFSTAESHLRALKFGHGVLISAALGTGNKGTGLVLRESREQHWTDRIPTGRRPGYSFQVPDRDSNGFQALGHLTDQGTNLVANALAQSCGHILSFFTMLCTELAFYVGCLNLHERLTSLGEPACCPVPVADGQTALSARGLHDACLTLTAGRQVVGNDLAADGKRLIMITGANQGGKSTFLRSVGIAQLMMQAGMFAPAQEFRAGLCQGVFSHYKREEDPTMTGGKLAEELSRISAVVGQLSAGSLLLCNESFASTNEREGSEIARQIIRALLDRGVRILFVTHLFDLAHRCYLEQAADALFLRAQRQANGTRSFRIVPGEPLPTSHGRDVYRRVEMDSATGRIRLRAATCGAGRTAPPLSGKSLPPANAPVARHRPGGICCIVRTTRTGRVPERREQTMTAGPAPSTAPHQIVQAGALEILDSRGRPTLQVSVTLDNGVTGTAGVPSGASTGSREATERRDGDKTRYRGLGVLGAAAAVDGEIAGLLGSRAWPDLAEIDAALITLDGTPTKARLGANAIVGVSMACARALAQAEGRELWDWLTPAGVSPRLPVPHFNVVNGGVHAPNPLDFQEFMIAPLGASSFPEAVRAGAEVYTALRGLLASQGHTTGLGDEGGFAPQLAEPEEVLTILTAAITEAGYPAGRGGVAIALDPAASEFRGPDGRYQVAGQKLTSTDMIDRYTEIIDRFPVWLIEDGLAEDDWDGWAALTSRLGERVQLVGDDIFVTNPAIIADAIGRGVANSALIKVNQIGTVTETLEAIATCRRGGYAQLVSHRSGETTDTFIADLAVSCGCGELKTGAPARGERVAKYNRLLSIAAAQPSLPYGLPARVS